LDYGPFAADGILWVSDRQQIDFVLLSLVNIFGCGFATCCSEKIFKSYYRMKKDKNL